MDYVHLMPDKVLKGSRRYLSSFLSYGENLGGEENMPSPSAGHILIYYLSLVIIAKEKFGEG